MEDKIDRLIYENKELKIRLINIEILLIQRGIRKVHPLTNASHLSEDDKATLFKLENELRLLLRT